MELCSATMTPWCYSKICGIHEKSRLELSFSKMTVESDSKFYPIHETRRLK